MIPSQASVLFATLLLGVLPASASLDCKNIRIKGHSFNLEKLSGPHSVVTSKWVDDGEKYINTTYTTDFCKPLKKTGEKGGESCPNGTRGMLFGLHYSYLSLLLRGWGEEDK